jgi:hypothetical protein
MTHALTPASNSSDWHSDVFQAVDDDTGEPFTLTGLSISVEVRNRYGNLVLSGTNSDGRVTVDGSEFEFVFPASLMSDLPADTYKVYARITDSGDGSISQAIVSNVSIYEGGFK